MKAERRHELKQNSLVRSLEGIPNRGKEFASRLSLGLVLVALVVVLIRYRMNSNAEQVAKARAFLAEANSSIRLLTSANPEQIFDGSLFFAFPGNEAREAQGRNEVYTTGIKAVDDALAAAPSGDAQIHAQALIARGDLNFSLANLPPIPGAATRPSLAPPAPQDQLLKDAESAYNQVLQQYPGDIAMVTSARFGIAAVAEDRAGLDPAGAASLWDKARDQYQAISDSSASQSLRVIADNRKALVDQLSKPPLVGLEPIGTSRPSSVSSTPLGPSVPLGGIFIPEATSPASTQSSLELLRTNPGTMPTFIMPTASSPESLTPASVTTAPSSSARPTTR
jgi:hypothetical protein